MAYFRLIFLLFVVSFGQRIFAVAASHDYAKCRKENCPDCITYFLLDSPAPSPEKRKAPPSTSEDSKRCKDLSSTESPHTKRWNDKFKLLKLFKKEHGHTRVPKRSKLGYWVGNQRRAYKNRQIFENGGPQAQDTHRVSPEQIAQLESIGFEWEVRNLLRTRNWDTKFKLLQQYFTKYENTKVSQNFDTQEFPKLGSWVATQRQAYKNEQKLKSEGTLVKNAHRISSERIAKLNSIGFVWRVREE